MPEPVQPNPNQNPPAPGATLNPPAPGNPPSPAPKPNGEKPPKGASIYEELHADDDKSGQHWPDDWRGTAAKGDTAKLERLKRFGDPSALVDSYLALEQRLRSGEYKRAGAPPDAEKDPEAYATWRQENGLPVKAEEYAILPEGVTAEKLDDGAKATVGKFQNAMHKLNLNQETAKGVAGFWYELAQEQLANEAQADGARADGAEDTLRADWGPEYRNNIAMNMAHTQKVFGEELGASIYAARLPDGSRLADLPEFSKAINAWARAEGGDIFVGGEGAAKTDEARITEIEDIMKADMSKYTPTLADEYGKLLDKREGRKSRQ